MKQPHHDMIVKGNLAILAGGDLLSRLVVERGMDHDGMMRERILPLLKPGDWVVDGGAALGDHTACYLNYVKPNGVVFAFEPHPEFFKCLMYNAPGAVSIPAALWNEKTIKTLNETAGNVGGSFIGDHSEFGDRTFQVKTMVLDDWNLQRLDFVKLDTEGTEFFALRGMSETIARCRPKIVVELRKPQLERYGVQTDWILSFLGGLNYSVQSICGHPDPASGMCDILALPL